MVDQTIKPRSRPVFLTALAAILAVGVGCGGDQKPDCPDGEELSKRRGQEKCRPTCEEPVDCQLNERCDDGVCLPRYTDDQEDAGPTDAGTDADGSAADTDAEADLPNVDTSSCPNGFAKSTYRGVRKCRRRCGEDIECTSGLVCKGRPGVEFCVDPATGTPDDAGTTDVDSGADGGGGDTSDTGDDAGPEGIDCFSILRCRSLCSEGEDSCFSKMTEAGTSTAQDNFSDLAQCFVDNQCGDEFDPQQCLDENCRNENGDGPADRCTPRSVSGDSLNCSDVVLCTSNCDRGDQSCFENCVSRGSNQGQTRAQNYFGCVQNECPSGSQSCFDQAIAEGGACHSDYTTCFGCP